MKFYKDGLWVTLDQIYLTSADQWKNMASGLGIFPLYGDSANYLLIIYSRDFNENVQGLFFE